MSEYISLGLGWPCYEYDQTLNSVFIWCFGTSILNIKKLKAIRFTFDSPPVPNFDCLTINNVSYPIKHGSNTIISYCNNLTSITINSKTFIPHEICHNNDYRPLGVCFRKIDIMLVDKNEFINVDIRTLKFVKLCSIIHPDVSVSEDKNKLLVVTHYNESLDWLKKLTIPYVVYSATLKTDVSKYIVHVDHNKGNEAMGFISYIIDNYNNLPDKMIEFHCDPYAWHQDRCIHCILNDFDWEFDYKSINAPFLYMKFGGDLMSGIDFGYRRSFDLWIKEPWKDIFGDYIPVPKELGVRSCAQFLVDKKLVLRYPIEFYKNIKSWLIATDIDTRLKIDPNAGWSSFVSSRIFEFSWHYIFTQTEIEMPNA